MTTDHERFEQDVGAYLLGALTDEESGAFERHASGCPACREELETLRVAADALPRTVERVEPSVGLKTSIMEAVRAEAAEAEAESPRPSRAAQRPGRFSLRGLLALPSMRPQLAGAAAAVMLLVGIGVGYAAFHSSDDNRVVAAQVDHSRIGGANASLVLPPNGQGAVLQVRNLPRLGPGQVYEVWVKRRKGIEVQPVSVFAPRPDGTASAGVPGDMNSAAAVYVTREKGPAGADKPGEKPVIGVQL